MAEREIHIQAHTNTEGIVHLDIPTGIADRDIQLKISFSTAEGVTTPTKDLAPRVPGIDEGRFVVPDDFDDPLPPELLEAFEGND
ncbi:hypothetical protein [Myxosarcina sp. GI1(2024)]